MAQVCCNTHVAQAVPSLAILAVMSVWPLAVAPVPVAPPPVAKLYRSTYRTVHCGAKWHGDVSTQHPTHQQLFGVSLTSHVPMLADADQSWECLRPVGPS
jgi:hypothetical protein